jgi:hypothetical membrane protein
MRRRRPPLTTIAGLATIVVGVGLALVAYAYYPRAFGPATNWLSDLGNTLLSPRGSLFFRVDMVVAGVALAVFFLGLGRWHRGQRLLFRGFLGIGQLSGLVAAAALAMSGVHSENHPAAHAFWVTTFFISLAIAIWFIGWAPAWHRPLPQWLPIVSVIAFAADLTALIARRHWLEWIAVGLLLCFVGAVALGAWMTAGRAAKAGPEANRRSPRVAGFPPVPWRRHDTRS